MRYGIILAPMAIQDLNAPPDEVRRFVYRQTASSTGSGATIRLTVGRSSPRFQYGVGEDVLHVLAVVHSTRDRADADEEEEGPAV